MIRMSFLLILTGTFFSACAPQLTATSSTSQVVYPGNQEVAPYQELVLHLDSLHENVQLDSVSYGAQTVTKLWIGKNAITCKANGTQFSNTAVLYYSIKRKTHTVTFDSIQRLDPLYMP